MAHTEAMRWFFLSILLSVLTPALAKADDLRALQGAVAASTQRAAEMARNRDTAHDETLRALKALSQTPASEKARAAYDSATTREQAAAIGELQAAAALRNARQRLTEAVNSAFEQGEAIERAAARAARGELTPSVTDPLACDGPDCVRISAREHAALVLMGAVGASFDPAKWPPPNSEPDITLMRYAPDSPPLATLRRAAEDAAQRAKETQSRALTLRATLTPATADIDAYASMAIWAAR
jgi:nucleotide-binding universal stress UspA family protein